MNIYPCHVDALLENLVAEVVFFQLVLRFDWLFEEEVGCEEALISGIKILSISSKF